MKKIVCILLACLSLAGCEKEWSFKEELSVNSTRINIPQLPPATSDVGFVLTVYSNTDWKVSVPQGGEWLEPAEGKGSKIGYVHVSYTANEGNPARIAKIKLESSNGKVITVNVVQDGTTETAESVSDYLL